MLYKETITPKMEEVHHLCKNLLPDLYLAGGTALALLIGHRKSIDLDYFTPRAFNVEELARTISNLGGEVSHIGADTLWVSIRKVKVSFIRRSAPLLLDKIDDDGFLLASMQDIILMKLNAICGRDEYKDYFDLACLTTKTDVRSWVTWWYAIYPHIDKTPWLVALERGQDVRMGDLGILPAFAHVKMQSALSGALDEIKSFI